MRIRASRRAVLLTVFAVCCVVLGSIGAREAFLANMSRPPETKPASPTPRLLDPGRVVPMPGNGLPLALNVGIRGNGYTRDPALPTVDGAADSPTSMAMYSFNQCSPACCPSAAGCRGGCVCITDKQRAFLARRGGNAGA
jgi:hypothetical protein